MPDQSELVAIQVSPSAVQPSVTRTETDMVIAPRRAADRLRHFPEEVYDLSPESHLSRFMKVLLGDAGAGALRKEAFQQRLRSTFQGSRFFDLDKFYGALFGMKRRPDEQLPFNPREELATKDVWADILTRDASFRSRMEQFSRAITFGATPAGMELIAEALLNVDCEVYEGYIDADQSFQTYGDLETLYGGENILTENQFGLETDTTGWSAGANTSIDDSTVWAYEGVASLELTSSAAGDISAVTSLITGLSAEEPYSFGAVFYLTEDRDIHVEIDWSDSVPSIIGTEVGDTISAQAGLPIAAYVSGISPVGTIGATIRVVVEGAVAGSEVHYVDHNVFVEGNETYAGMEGQTYFALEGGYLNNSLGDEIPGLRRVFTVRPKRKITLQESYDLRRVLNRLKPADARLEIVDTGVLVHEPVAITNAWADSNHWEIKSKVKRQIAIPNPPYLNLSDVPEEQPRPVLSGFQGEAWSYVTNLAGVVASYITPEGDVFQIPTQRVTYLDGSTMDFPPEQSVLSAKSVQEGRAVSDAVMVTDSSSENIYVDGIPLNSLNYSLRQIDIIDPFQQNAEHRYWTTIERPMSDRTEEVLEVRMASQQLVNYVTFEMAKFPHQVICEVNDPDGSGWTEVFRTQVDASTPRFLMGGDEAGITAGHPQHVASGHWNKVSRRIEPVRTDRVRLRMQRINGLAPIRVIHSANLKKGTEEVPYSLAIRGLDIGYRVTSRRDFDFIEGDLIGQTLDPLGSLVRFEKMEYTPDLALDDLTESVWKSEPQPINSAVINFYVEVGSEVVDRFYIDPTHAGVSFAIYYSNDDIAEPDEEALAMARWTPIPRSYTLQKGFIHIPPTKARFYKFEFTNLASEMYESFVPITRQIKRLPIYDVPHGHALEARIPGMTPTIEASSEMRFSDAIAILPPPSVVFEQRDYRPTESLSVTDPESQMRLRDDMWEFGFTEWHMGEPRVQRFDRVGIHVYDTVEIAHDSKMAFFVGLRTIKAYRAKFEEPDDSEVYFDTFGDLRNLELDTQLHYDENLGYLLSSDPPPIVATSRTFRSLHNIKAVQFATVQSDPVQLVVDHTFRNAFFGSYTWDDPDYFLRVGDARLIYSPSDYSVINIRRVDIFAGPGGMLIDGMPFDPGDGETTGSKMGADRRIPDPVNRYQGEQGFDPEAGQGGMATPEVLLSDQGRAFVAARFTMETEQSSPLFLQAIDTDGDVLIKEIALTAELGETVEAYVGFDIPAPGTFVRARLVQRGPSNDRWKTKALSVFDEGMYWEFSNNGGEDWYPAHEIRNNDNGILTFPLPGNQLKYRLNVFRADRWVSGIKIRPHYVETGNARPIGTHRGPNVSLFDHDVPIHQDPMFTTWKKPIPYWWFEANRRFPILSLEGQLGDSALHRFFNRPVGETVTAPSVTAEVISVVRGRIVNEIIPVPVIEVDREGGFNRGISENVPEPTEESLGFEAEGDSVNTPIPNPFSPEPD